MQEQLTINEQQQSNDVIVQVPSEDVLLLSVNLPDMSRARLMQALPFALEEQIIGDLDEQHIVVVGDIIAGNVPVAVVTHHKMRLWLDQLNERGVQADCMLPASVALPAAPQMNLLQGRYAVKKSRVGQTKKIYRIAVMLAVAWLGLLLLYPLISYFILKTKVSTINSQIATIYHHAFPNATSVVAPKMRMEEKLHQVTSQLGSNKFLLLAGYVGKGMLAAPTVTLKRLQFQNNHLSLEVSANSVADFSSFIAYLQQQGLNVKQENANVAGTRVTAIVEVE